MSSERGQVVVMDDSWLILEKIRESLALAGYNVRTTTSLEVAAKLAKSSDLAVIDFHMPGMNGKEVLEHIKRTLPADSICQFYLYTSDPEQASRYRIHGFDGAFLMDGPTMCTGRSTTVSISGCRQKKPWASMST